MSRRQLVAGEARAYAPRGRRWPGRGGPEQARSGGGGLFLPGRGFERPHPGCGPRARSGRPSKKGGSSRAEWGGIRLRNPVGAEVSDWSGGLGKEEEKPKQRRWVGRGKLRVDPRRGCWGPGRWEYRKNFPICP